MDEQLRQWGSRARRKHHRGEIVVEGLHTGSTLADTPNGLYACCYRNQAQDDTHCGPTLCVQQLGLLARASETEAVSDAAFVSRLPKDVRGGQTYPVMPPRY